MRTSTRKWRSTRWITTTGESTLGNEITNNEIAPPTKIDYNNLSWEDIPPQVGMKRVPFNGKPGVKHFFTDELIEHIVYYANLFAEQSIAEK